MRVLPRGRFAGPLGTVLCLLVAAAFLLSAPDLWAIQARAVGSLLRATGVRREVITRADVLARTSVGRASRAGRVRGAHGPVIRLTGRPPAARARWPEAIATAALAAAALATLTRARRLPPQVLGAVLLAGVLATASLVYSAVWARPPLDVRTIVVDWRTSAVGPIVVLALLFAADVYVVPGNFALKAGWLVAGALATAGFSTVRLAAVVAGYAAAGPRAFLPLNIAAGVFWDLAPGVAVMAAAHASLAPGSGT